MRQQGLAVERAGPVGILRRDPGKQRMLCQPANGGDLQVGLAEKILNLESKVDQTVAEQL